MANVYAEEQEPINLSDFMVILENLADFDIKQGGCEKFTDGIAPLIQCYLEGFPYPIVTDDPSEIDTDVFECADIGLVDNPEIKLTYDPDTETCMTPEDLAIAAIEKVKTALVFEQPLMTDVEKLIIYLEAIENPTLEEFERLNQAKQIDDCANTMSLTQTFREFVVLRNAEGELVIDNSIDNEKHRRGSVNYTTDLGIQECIGQQLYINGNVRYGNILAAQDDKQSHPAFAEGLPVYTQEIMLERANWGFEQPPTIEEIVCDGYFSQAHIISTGICPKEYDMNYDIPKLYNSDEVNALLASVQNWKDGNETEQLQKITTEALNEARQKTLNQPK